MKKWVIIDVTGMDTNGKKIVDFSKAKTFSTDEAIGFLADF